LLPADADVLLQVHLRRRGKVEEVQPEIGFYFTDKRPEGLLFRMSLRSTAIDIPAGASDYTVSTSYTLPVDVEALSISAHAHYLGKEVHGFATLPDGTQVELLKIARWNFNMQDSYTYKAPVRLPRGAKIEMRWVFDNSEQNPVNPNTPPQRVQYGPNSTDEMAELSLQLRAHNQADYALLAEDFTKKWMWPDAVEFQQNRLKQNPGDARIEVELAKLYMRAGLKTEMAKHLNAAFKLDAKCAAANYLLAHLLAERNDFVNAADRYRRCLAADPENFRAQADLALVLGMLGKLDESVAEFESALRLNPRDSLAHANLGKIYLLQGKVAQARKEVETALRLDPDQGVAKEAMKGVEGMEKRRP
jgi:tetratricopeptide (TPR) repeat protein